jgi:hypothetical protein
MIWAACVGLATQIDYRDVHGIKFPFDYQFLWLDGRFNAKLNDVPINAASEFSRRIPRRGIKRMLSSTEMRRVTLTVLIVCTLGLNLAQCVAACVVEKCNPAGVEGDGPKGDVPPCCQHHHQTPDRQAPGDQASASCSHEFLVPGASSTIQLSPTGNIIASLTYAPVAGSPSTILGALRFAPAFSPPDLALASRAVLRI